MQPYVIRQGDFLASVAYEQGFDADTVWGDPSNADLRQLRPDPNLLAPGDVLQVPDPPLTPDTKALTPGATNSFVTSAPAVTITVKFADPTLASQAFTIAELPDLAGLSTLEDGVASFSAPVTLDVATIVFTASGFSVCCKIGHLNPINTLLGVFQRLQHLGYIGLDVTLDVTPIESIREALRAFKASQSPGAPASGDPAPESTPSPPSGPASAPATQPPPSAPASAPASGQPAPSPPPSEPPGSSPTSAPGSTPESGPQPPPSGPVSSPPSSGSSTPSDPPPSSDAVPDSSPPPSTPAPDSSDSSSTGDNAGLDDNGTLDAATTQMLLDAHGL